MSEVKVKVDFNKTVTGELSGIQVGARKIEELLLGCKDLAKEYSKHDIQAGAKANIILSTPIGLLSKTRIFDKGLAH